MSFCRGRLLFQTKPERRSQDIDIVQTLNFAEDSDVEDGDCEKGCATPFASFSMGNNTPPRTDSSPSFWDSGLGSPTPHSSPYRTRRSPNSKLLSSPIAPFNCDDSVSDDDRIPPVPPSPSPPHKKLRSLRLYDIPHTPKSLVQRAQRRVVRINRDKPYCGPGGKQSKLDPDGPQINVNPFTPTPTLVPAKRGRQALDGSLGEDQMEDEMEDDTPSNKVVMKLALHEINTSRYIEEFYEVCKLGDGAFGSVFKCINRLDGCTYAIKKSKMPVAGSVYERNALNEVYAHAVLGKHAQVVRYYSAWAENDHMYIQNEYCNGGCLSDVIAESAVEGECLSEPYIRQLLLQLAQGLRYIHSQNLVHLDIKPGNVFLHRNPQQNSESGVEEDLLEEGEAEDCDAPDYIVFKIGDLGHVTSMSTPQVEEGDCRYLPKEILQEDFTHLSKADVFSLALTVYEAAGGGELPKNGDLWHAIRRGELPELTHYSAGLNNLLKSMVHPDPKLRPSASQLVHQPFLCPMAKKSRAQLRRELNEEKFKNEILSRRLFEVTHKQTGSEEDSDKLTALKPPKRHRLVGKKIGRSMSAVNF